MYCFSILQVTRSRWDLGGCGNKAICSHMTSHDMANGHTSLVPRPLPLKVERGSGVLSDISCYMGRGLRCKECLIYSLHPGLEFSDDLDAWYQVDKDLIRLRCFLGKLRTSCEVSFFYLLFGSKYNRLRHAHIIMRSRI